MTLADGFELGMNFSFRLSAVPRKLDQGALDLSLGPVMASDTAVGAVDDSFQLPPEADPVGRTRMNSSTFQFDRLYRQT